MSSRSIAHKLTNIQWVLFFRLLSSQKYWLKPRLLRTFFKFVSAGAFYICSVQFYQYQYVLLLPIDGHETPFIISAARGSATAWAVLFAQFYAYKISFVVRVFCLSYVSSLWPWHPSIVVAALAPFFFLQIFVYKYNNKTNLNGIYQKRAVREAHVVFVRHTK